ncbi:hypothetical protein RVM26_11130 [Halomonas sp. KM072]|jgi:enamine deaminase RidA (YjgF/YER057c/UK114 family)
MTSTTQSMNTRSLALTCRLGGKAMYIGMGAIPAKPYPNWMAVGVTWLAGFDFEIKVIARLPTT